MWGYSHIVWVVVTAGFTFIFLFSSLFLNHFGGQCVSLQLSIFERDCIFSSLAITVKVGAVSRTPPEKSELDDRLLSRIWPFKDELLEGTVSSCLMCLFENSRSDMIPSLFWSKPMLLSLSLATDTGRSQVQKIHGQSCRKLGNKNICNSLNFSLLIQWYSYVIPFPVK